MINIIEAFDTTYIYQNSDIPKKAVDEVTLSIKNGEYIALLGKNGSGKSTLARLFNSLLLPSGGDVIVLGKNSKDDENVWYIRKKVGMIFQNPDNQIIGTTVIEDVAFGPENLGIKQEEIENRAIKALNDIGILDLKERAPHMLSGGQKQKVGVASVLAMHPSCIIMDESTSMLDPRGREELLRTVKQLNVKEKITIINITHHMEEACLADRVIIIDEGKIVTDGKPVKVFNDVEKIEEMGLDVPQVTRLLYKLKEKGYIKRIDAITVDEAFERIIEIIE
ncbi:MAG: energy-coupling factor transporter ATPase [Clostridia bacterium]|nr:energy-coupling factor transporter ATPase [Clostridia bacterium]